MIKYLFQCFFVALLFNQAVAQTTYTVQPDGTAGIDAWVVSEYTPNNDTSNNYGTDARLDAWRWTNTSVPYSTRGYLKFDVSSLPTSAVVCSAILTVHTDANNEMSGHTQPNAFYLKRATSSWTETGITWHNQPTLSTTDIISVGSYTSTTTGTSYTIDISSHIQDMINNPSTNYGWAIMLQNEVNTYAALGLASSDHATAAYRPMLTVVYVSSLTVTPTSATVCAGGSSTLTVSGASTYSWTPSSGLSATTGTSVVATPTASTIYTVTGTTGSCSTATKTISVTVNPLPTLSVSPSSTPTICKGSSITFTASGASTYTWTPNTSLTCSVCASPIANPTATTNYTVTGTNSNGCINTKAVTLTVNPLPTLTVSPSSTPTICKGSSITFTASGASTYTWTPNTSLTCSVCVSPIANPTATTNYTVTGTNSNGCINTKAVTLTVNPTPTVTVNSPDTIYGSQTATLTASGASTYSWTPATGLSATTGSTVIASPTVTTIYTVTGTGANTCTASATANVVNLNVYFRSAATGNWNTNSTWQSSLDNTTWTSATSTPNYKSRTVTIQTGHKVTIPASVTIDETVVNGSLIYGNVVGNYLTINDGTGTDLTINGSFQHNSPDSVIWLASSTWSLGANDTLLINTNTTGQGWRTKYAGGISSIPSTANWILNKTSTANPTLYSNTGMYYPNLIIQNNTGTTWTTSTSSGFVGSNAPPTILGNLSIGGAGTGNVVFLDTNNNASSILVKGNLTINSGSILRSHGTGFSVQGNLVLNGTIDYGTSSGMVLSGSNNQTISGSSLSFKNLSLNKSSFAATVTLNAPAIVTGAFTFIKGVLITDTINLLTFNAGSSASGTNNDSSFVSGPVKKIGNTAFTFPLGKHSNAQTIGITAPSNSTDAFQAEYFDTNPTTLYGNLMDTTFDYVNTCQYFNLYRKNGTTNVQPTLSYDLSSCVLQMYPSPRVILFNGTKWTDKGEANFTYGSFGGTISTASVISSYGHITLGNYSLGSSPIDTTFINLNPTSPPDFANEPPNNAYSYYANQGQVSYFGTNHTLADSVKFVSELTSPKFYFADKKVSTVYFNEYPLNDTTVIDTIQRIDMNFYHCTTDAHILGNNPSGSSFNYAWGFINSGQGLNGVIGNERLYITNIYKNIDFHVFSNQKGVKYYFVVRPGGNPSNINLQFTGAKSLALAGDSLTINSFNSRMTFQQPIAYYATDSLHIVQNPGTISWANTGTNLYGVSISSYNNALPLVIEMTQGADATLSTGSPYWSTCIPGSSDEVGRTIDYDPVNDYLFVGGETNSSISSGYFPISASTGGFQTLKRGLRDGYILAFDPTRKLYWGTYIGGDQNDYVHKIKYSPIGGGKLYLVGSTFSENQSSTTGSKFPTQPKTGAFNQLTGGGSIDPNFGSGYIARLNVYGTTSANRGKQEWTSFFGSSYSAITGLDEDTITRNIYICGTLFTNPSSSTSCSPTGGMVLCKPYSTSYLAGFSGNSDPSGTIGSEGFIAKFDSACVLGWSTMIGTRKDDYMFALAVDAANHSLSVVGATDTTIRKVGTGYRDTTNSNTVYNDGWFLKFNTNDYSRKWQTLFGGTRDDSPRGVAIDSKGNTFVTGVTTTLANTTPTACNAAQSIVTFPLCYSSPEFGEQFPSGGGSTSVNNFIAEFDTTNNLVWSSIIGTNSEYSEPTSRFFWSGSPSVCVDKVTNAIHVCGTTMGLSNTFIQSSSSYDYNNNVISQYSPTATNVYITAFDGATNGLNWGTLFGGEGSRTLNNTTAVGPSTIVEGDAGTDIVSYNGKVFITGASLSNNTFPTAYPPSNTTAYVQPHSNGLNQDIIVAQFTGPSNLSGIKSVVSKKENEYVIYPNPNNGNFTIQGNIPANSKIQIMNGIGQLVYSAKQEHTLAETTINLANLQQGIYIISIIKENGISSQKIIIFN